MKRPLTWLVVGVAAIGIGVPAYAAVQSNVTRPTPDDNGVPGELRGNCDEAEHAADPECAGVAAPTTGATTPTTATTVATTAATSPVISVSVPSVSTPDVSAPDVSAPGVSTPSNTAPSVSAPGVSTGDDISGPCDEAEHANDPRCTGSATGGSGQGSDDNGGHGRGSDDPAGDDNGGRGSDDAVGDDNSGRGSDDSGSDDSGSGGNDDTGHETSGGRNGRGHDDG